MMIVLHILTFEDNCLRKSAITKIEGAVMLVFKTITNIEFQESYGTFPTVIISKILNIVLGVIPI